MFRPDVILCGRLGPKHQLTTSNQFASPRPEQEQLCLLDAKENAYVILSLLPNYNQEITRPVTTVS